MANDVKSLWCILLIVTKVRSEDRKDSMGVRSSVMLEAKERITGSSQTGERGGPRRRGPEVGRGAITTPLGVFQPEFVVHCLAESLLAAEIAFGGLNRCVSKQELNLLKFSAR